MGYLDNTTITVDAILTKKGRELLAKGRNQFNITQFALADDEIDYDLWNPSHPGGTDYYGSVIENMPITEAVPDETQSLKYKLITMPQGTTQIPYIDLKTSSGIQAGFIELTTNKKKPADGVLVKPKTIQLSLTGNITDPNSSYSYHILDNTYATFSTETSMLAGRSVSVPDVPASQGVIIVATGTELPADVTATTKLIISGNQTGARVVIPIKITQATTVVRLPDGGGAVS
jgi:hypothetical protein